MKRPNDPTEKVAKQRNHPSARTRKSEGEAERTVPGRRSPAVEKQRERIVNEDEQLKAVNNREDNAQSSSASTPQEETRSAAAQDNENERLEAGYDNSEVNPRPPKVN
jgi:hypothetical protein